MKHFKIEKGIEIPPKQIPHSVFPLSEMEVGDSFFVHMRDFKVDNVLSLKNRVYSRIKKYQQEADIDNSIFRITTQRTNKGVRVFKVS